MQCLLVNGSEKHEAADVLSDTIGAAVGGFIYRSTAINGVSPPAGSGAAAKSCRTHVRLVGLHEAARTFHCVYRGAGWCLD